MTADVFTTPNERALSGAMALVMHGLFFALLVFGVTWQKRESPAMVVDLWNNLPPLAVPKAEAPPAPEAKPEPPPPKAEAKPVPRVEPAPLPKADIALKDKKEKERKAQEQRLAEKKKREQEQLAVLKEQQTREAEARRLAREQEEALRRIAREQAAAQAREVDKYKRAIAERIKRFIIEPPNLQGNPEVELDVIVLLPEGQVLDVKTRRKSGQDPWDNAVERAILKAQPLPLPPDPALAKEFRELNLKFRPKE